jgi:hypothetical protein
MSEDKLIDIAAAHHCRERSQWVERRFQENSHERFFFSVQAADR